MPDTTHRFFARRLPLLAVLVLLPCLLSNSCASSGSTRKDYAVRGLSDTAESDYLFLVYQDLLHEGHRDEALATLNRLVKLHPSPDSIVELANLQWSQNHREQATATLEKGLAAFPDDRALSFYLANAYQMRRMHAEAASTLQHFLSRHPDDGPAARELASILLDAGRFQEANAVLLRLPEAKRDAMTWYLLAKASLGLGQPRLAERQLRLAVQKKDTFLAGWAELATVLEKQGDLKAAEDCYRKMQSLGASSLQIRAKLVRLAIARKDPAAAFKLLAADEKNKSLLLDAMSAFLEAKDVRQAKKVLHLLAVADPSSPDLLFYRAVLAYEGEHNPTAALTFLSQVPTTNPNYDKSLGFRIQIALELGDTAKAQALVREARQRFPDKKEFVIVQAGIEDKLGRTEDAAATLKASLNTWPDDVDILYRYGVALEKLKRRSEARAVMEKIVRLDPTNPDALNYLGYSLAEEGHDLDKALSMIDKALQKDPTNPFFLDSKAWVLFRLHRSQEALSTIEQAISHKVKDAIIWEHYGDIAAANGRTEIAKKAYRTALDLGSETPDAVKKKLEAL